MDVTGKIANPVAPDFQLAVTSPDLDLDRLIPPGGKNAHAAGSSRQKSEEVEAEAGKSELPSWARKVTGQLQVQARQGRYRGLRFQDLNLGAAYDRGLLTEWSLDFRADEGHVSARGSADLRDPERIPLVVRPQITSLKLEAGTPVLGPVLGLDAVPVTGPISLTGQLRGHTGTTKDLLGSLEGNLDATMGPGRFSRVGKIGAPMEKLLSFASVRGLLSGKLLSDLTGKGLAYRTIRAQTAFDKGVIELRAFSFESDAMNIDAQGRINVLNEQMDVKAELRPLDTADKLLGFLPIVGKPLEAVTSIPLEAQGPLDDPDIRLAVGQGVEGAIREETKGTGSTIKGFTDFLRRSTGKPSGK